MSVNVNGQFLPIFSILIELYYGLTVPTVAFHSLYKLLLVKVVTTKLFKVVQVGTKPK